MPARLISSQTSNDRRTTRSNQPDSNMPAPIQQPPVDLAVTNQDNQIEFNEISNLEMQVQSNDFINAANQNENVQRNLNVENVQDMEVDIIQAVQNDQNIENVEMANPPGQTSNPANDVYRRLSLFYAKRVINFRISILR